MGHNLGNNLYPLFSNEKPFGVEAPSLANGNLASPYNGFCSQWDPSLQHIQTPSTTPHKYFSSGNVSAGHFPSQMFPNSSHEQNELNGFHYPSNNNYHTPSPNFYNKMNTGNSGSDCSTSHQQFSDHRYQPLQSVSPSATMTASGHQSHHTEISKNQKHIIPDNDNRSSENGLSPTQSSISYPIQMPIFDSVLEHVGYNENPNQPNQSHASGSNISGHFGSTFATTKVNNNSPGSHVSPGSETKSGSQAAKRSKATEIPEYIWTSNYSILYLPLSPDNRSIEPVPDQKHHRPKFSDFQTQVFLQRLSLRGRLKKEEVKMLAKNLKLEGRSVRNWFCNHKRKEHPYSAGTVDYSRYWTEYLEE